MTTLRRLSYAAVAVAFLHIVFGAIVRISGSGMGCGDHWPKCYGYWFPPFDRPDLVIEVLHRYFAATLITVVLALVAVALLRRREPGATGPGGVLRAAGLASGLVTFAAAFGAVTVRFANAPWATVTHKGIAAALLAALAAATVRAGGFGGAQAATTPTSAKTARAAYVAAALAIVAVLLGGLTAKVAGGAVACRGFPLCGAGSLGGGAQHVQLTHRVVAYLLALHLIGLAVAVTRRRESGPVAAAARVAAVVVVVQIALGAAMVLAGFYPVLRSLHQATGITLWLTTFVMAYLARRGASPGEPAPIGERPAPPPPRTRPVTATAAARASGPVLHRGDDARAVAERPAVVAAELEVAAMELAVANGGTGRAGPLVPWHTTRRPTPPPLQLVRGPSPVVHAEPLRRGVGRERRRGREATSRPFRVIDGRVRPAGAVLPPLPVGPVRPAVPVRAGAAPVGISLMPDDRGALAFELAHAGPEFTIVVWAAEVAARGEVSAPVVAGHDETMVTRHHVLRRSRAAYAAPPGTDAAMIEALLGEASGGVSAPSVAAVRRARRYSVAVLVARGAEL